MIEFENSAKELENDMIDRHADEMNNFVHQLEEHLPVKPK